MATCLQKRKSRALLKLTADIIAHNKNKLRTNSYTLKYVTSINLQLKANLNHGNSRYFWSWKSSP